MLSGASQALQAAETSLHQDINGDGTIGVPPTLIEAIGSTRLDLAGSAYSLDPVAGGPVPAEVPRRACASGPVWFVGADRRGANGQRLRRRLEGRRHDQYIVWNTDSSGNYLSDGGVLSGTSQVLQAAETSLHQDLNGDGTIGVPATVSKRLARPGWTWLEVPILSIRSRRGPVPR